MIGSQAMDVYDAIRKVQQIHETYLAEQQAKNARLISIEDPQERKQLAKEMSAADDNYTVRRGSVSVSFGAIQRGLDVCPLCGATTGMGVIIITHDELGEVDMPVQMYHYAEVKHPIGSELFHSELLAMIMADA